jgi:hypothetical protein
MTLHLVLACTKTKKTQPSPGLCLGSIPDQIAWEKRQDLWIDKITSVDGAPTCEAIDLYSGGGWRSLKELLKSNLCRGQVKTWICSAGYGFLCESERIKAYSATFALGECDSITKFKNLETQRGWWSRINQKLDKKNPYKTILDLVRENPLDCYLIAIPFSYLVVIQEDLAKMEKILGNERLIILQIGSRSVLKSINSVLNVDSRVIQILGGVLSSLYLRLVSHIICALGENLPNFLEIRKLVMDLNSRILKRNKKKGRKIADEEVERLIIEMVSAKQKRSASLLLNELRNAGISCEQKRFHRIFNNVKGS